MGFMFISLKIMVVKKLYPIRFSKIALTFLSLLIVCLTTNLFAQQTKVKFGKGLAIMAEDSSLYLKFTTRFQSLYELKQAFTEDNKTSGAHSNKILIRRARLKFDGFALTPKLKYKVELGVSNRDVGGSSDDAAEFNNGSNIILDAVLKWNFYENLELWCGQTKLPGNRERVVSSQKLQLVDRSQLNSRFNIDRDMGVQLRNKGNIGDIIVKESVAITMGEGRDVTSSTNGGYSYTAHVEVLPFGEFSKKGDYVGGDLEREETPKLAVAAAYNYNRKALRSRGQLGGFIEGVPGSLHTIFADFMFKYKGFSAMGEFASRAASDLQTVNDVEINPYYTGQGINFQVGYLCKSNYEVATRLTNIVPEGSKGYNQYTVGVSKYIVGHSLKVQTDISWFDSFVVGGFSELMYRFQVELQL